MPRGVVFLSTDPGLSDQYAAATADVERTTAMVAGRAMLAMWQATAFQSAYIVGSGAARLLNPQPSAWRPATLSWIPPGMSGKGRSAPPPRWMSGHAEGPGRAGRGRVRLAWADGGYAGKLLDLARDCCRSRSRSSNAAMTRPDSLSSQDVGSWRILAWITRHRRCARDYEALPAHHEAMVRWAMIRITSRRRTHPRSSGTASEADSQPRARPTCRQRDIPSVPAAAMLDAICSVGTPTSSRVSALSVGDR
jgi:hypothetical protein